MAEKENKYQSDDYITPPADYSSPNQAYHFAPYKGSAVFHNMKKRAEQAMTDHEFKG